MRLTGLIDCCGVDVLSQFGNTNTAAVQVAYSIEEIRAFLIEKEANSRRFRKAALIATLNTDQHKKFGKLFKELKWRTVSKSFHQNHQQDIYVMVKALK